MTLYTIRPNFTIWKNGVVYISGQQIDLSPAEVEIHKHKLEGIDSNVIPLNLPSAIGNYDDSVPNLGASDWQEAIAALDTRLDLAEDDFSSLAASPANTVKGRIGSSGIVQDLTKAQTKEFLDLGQGYYKGVTPYPYTPVAGDIWEELDENNLFIKRWFWNGALWLDCELRSLNASYNPAVTSTANPYIQGLDTNYDVFAEDFVVRAYVQNNNDANRYWSFGAYFEFAIGGAAGNLFSPLISTQGLSNQTYHLLKKTINAQYLTVSSFPISNFRIAVTRVGTPGGMLGSAFLTYRLVRR